MKWLGGSGSAAGAAGEPAPPVQLHHTSANGHLPTEAETCGQVMAGGDAVRLPPGQTLPVNVNRVQDETMVGYVFQRPNDQDFGVQTSAFQSKQAPRAWALADDGVIDNQTQHQQLGLQTVNNVHMPYEIHPMQLKSGTPGAEHLVYLNNQMTAQQQVCKECEHSLRHLKK
ncbi:hypothetical protein QAD02_004915 [Eretmocerus hayati]|uniref:Uncharacterized protein n=1 Tax=Eretmocerus hayati TaxID=131215 RepID=A0ACC2NS35_9HYME|nr:hypothetical protein QAD02_004915 [Eretmocerus hayati]